jgi:prepilin-type N-terminal cleavage/methylation domain-containing protein
VAAVGFWQKRWDTTDGMRMFNSTCKNKGISLIEVLIAIALISIGILSLLSLQPPAWKLSRQSDFLGRAGSILHAELESNQILLMNPNYPNPCSPTNPLTLTKTVRPSGQSSDQLGDLTFTVVTAIQDNLNNSWVVRVRVTWTGNNAGLSETRIITRQESFRF